MTDILSTNGLLPPEDLYYLLGGNDKIRLLDATYVSIGGLSPYQAFLGQRIAGAQFFDVDAVADQESPFPHMLPSPGYFADCVSALGISNDDHVVIYDQSGAYMASARAWWMFRTFGHDKVYVLDGGLQAWKARGFQATSGPIESSTPGVFKAEFRQDLVIDRNDVLNNIDTGNFTLVDTRPAGRYAGNLPEPRERMRAGHIPKSVNIPFSDVLDASYFKKPAELENVFSQKSLGPDAPIAFSCGSGITACVGALALFHARGQEAAIYDGSWSEWGHADAGTPIELSA